MDERIVQFRVGVMVIAALIITGILVLLFGELPTFGGAQKTVFILFTSAPGVSRDTPVRKDGLLIGRVTDVQFEEGGGVLVTASIDDNIRNLVIRRNEVCRISGSLLGDAVLQFVPSGDPKLPDTPIEDGEPIQGVASPDPLQLVGNLEGSLTEALGSIANTSNEIGRLARHVSDLLETNDDQFGRIANKAESTLDHLNSVAANVDEILGDQQSKDNFKKALADLPELFKETRDAVQGIHQTLDLADRNLSNLEGLTRPLGERGGQLVENIDRTTARLDRVLAEFETFSAAINNPNGSLGRLLNDPELYRHLNSAARNVDNLTKQMRPILDDIRVFSDKVARHPGDLGVRGALKHDSGLK